MACSIVNQLLLFTKIIIFNIFAVGVGDVTAASSVVNSLITKVCLPYLTVPYAL